MIMGVGMVAHLSSALEVAAGFKEHRKAADPKAGGLRAVR
jgi:hypothetical protein